jgi:alanine racemase
VNDMGRPSRVEIDLESLRFNVRKIRSWIGDKAGLMAVVKADAYGHGAVPVSRVMSEEGVDFLGVAMLEEADEIRQSGIDTPIVILYPEDAKRSAESAQHGYCITLSDIGFYHEIRRTLGSNDIPIKYFLNINTGMNRYGMNYDDAAPEASVNNSGPPILIGFTTNLADPARTNPILADRQVEKFLKFVHSAQRFSRDGLLYSYESSGSLCSTKALNGSLVRVGILMYGVAPHRGNAIELKPVMSVKSRISEIHDLQEGDGVGYGFSFIAARKSRVAVIPMGYADGYPWSLSNRGAVIIRGSEAPVVGRVCMDAFMVDVTDIEGCAVGDDVVLLGSMGKARIDADRLGDWAGSFSYEILSGWQKRLPRVYIDSQN